MAGLRHPSAAVGAVYVITMIGTTLPTPLYSFYSRRFGFGTLGITVVFALYALGALVALLTVGNASDRVGRRPMLAVALTASGLSAVVFLGVAGVHSQLGIGLLLVARFVSGLSAGAVMGTGTAMLTDLDPDRGAQVAAMSNMAGLGGGPLLAGVLASYLPGPLWLAFVVDAGLLGLAGVIVARLPETVRPQRRGRFRPTPPGVPAQARTVFLGAAAGGFASFAVLGLFTAVGPSLLMLITGHASPAATGVIVALVFAASAVAQGATASMETARATRLGAAVIGVGMVGVAAAAQWQSLPVLVAAAILAGAGQGAVFRGTLGAATAASPPDRRAQVSASFYAVIFVGTALPVIGVGLLADPIGLPRACQALAVLVLVLVGGAAVGVAQTVRTAPVG